MGTIAIKYIPNIKNKKPNKVTLVDLPMSLIGESIIPRRKKMHRLTKHLFYAFNILYPNSPISDENKKQACSFVLNLSEFKSVPEDLLKDAIEAIPDFTNKDVEFYNIKQLLSKSLVKVLGYKDSEYPYFKNFMRDQKKFHEKGLSEYIHKRLKSVFK